MTATVNRRGQIVLRPADRERLGVRQGDVLQVLKASAERIILQKRKPKRAGSTRSRKAYLVPQPVSPATLKRLYRRSATEWDKVEVEAVSLGRQALAGRQLEEL